MTIFSTSFVCTCFGAWPQQLRRRPTSQAFNTFPFNFFELWEEEDHFKVAISFMDMCRAPLWAQNGGGFIREPEFSKQKDGGINFFVFRRVGGTISSKQLGKYHSLDR